jgi:hypothetical protein
MSYNLGGRRGPSSALLHVRPTFLLRAQVAKRSRGRVVLRVRLVRVPVPRAVLRGTDDYCTLREM